MAISNLRISQETLDVLSQGDAKLRISQLSLDTLEQGDAKTRISQISLDVLIFLTGLSASLGDTLDLSDSINVDLQIAGSSPDLTKVISDTLDLSDSVLAELTGVKQLNDSLSLSDSIHVDFLIYTEPLTVQLSDRLEIFESALEIQPLGYDDYLLDIRETLQLQDHLDIGAPIEQELADALSLSELFEILVPGWIECFDTLQYNWGDSLVSTLAQELAFTDALSFSDAAVTDLVIVALIVSLADTLSLSDAILLYAVINKQLSDNFTISDELITAYTVALNLEDSMTLADLIKLAFLSGQSGLSDSFTLSDAVSVSLSTPLEVALEDTISLSDAIRPIKLSTDLSYLRRYLNDVPR